MRLRWPFVMRWELEVAEESLDWYRKRCLELESTKNQLYAEVARLSAGKAKLQSDLSNAIHVNTRQNRECYRLEGQLTGIRYILNPEIESVKMGDDDPRFNMSMPMGLPGCKCSQ